MSTRSPTRGGPMPSSATPGRTGWCPCRRPEDGSSRGRTGSGCGAAALPGTWSAEVSGGASAARDAATHERLQYPEPVGRGELLPVLAGAGLVAHRHLVDALTLLDQPRRDLGLDVEAARLQRERAEDVGADRLVAGHQVAQVDVEENVGSERHALVAHHVHERVARVAVEGAHAEDRVREALLQRR